MSAPTLDQAGVRARILASVERMSPLSPTTAKVLGLVNDIDASPWELLQVIKMDPVLTGRVLRLVNSAHFGFPEPVLSVNRALVILGLNTVKNLALSSAMIEALTGQTEEDALSADLWNHSLWVAVSARAIARARQLGRDMQELAFITGLLHDLGEICLLKVFPQEFRAIVRRFEGGEDQLEAERETFGATHTEYGGELGRYWGLPSELIVALETHHDPLIEGPMAAISCTAYLANFFAAALEGSGRGARLQWHPSALTALSLDERTVVEAVKSVASEVEASRIFLEAR